MKAVGDSHKTAKISEYIRHGTDQYLSFNADMLGRVFVQKVFLTDDCRSARIFISAKDDKDLRRALKILKKDVKNVISYVKKEFSSKYFPTIKFEGCDEEVDF